MTSQKQLGRYIVTDPKICHGQPTFRGTRILVSDVLDQLADGLAWETILGEWHGSLSSEAIAEALDENILESQRELLHRRRIRARQIGVDIGKKGLPTSRCSRCWLPS